MTLVGSYLNQELVVIKKATNNYGEVTESRSATYWARINPRHSYTFGKDNASKEYEASIEVESDAPIVVGNQISIGSNSWTVREVRDIVGIGGASQYKSLLV